MGREEAPVTLRLVKPEGPKPPKRKSQRNAPVLSREQQAKARAALKNLRFKYGGWAPLAEVIGGPTNTVARLVSERFTITGDMLIRICRAGGLSVDAMLGAKLTPSGRCSSCGALRRSA